MCVCVYNVCVYVIFYLILYVMLDTVCLHMCVYFGGVCV